MKGYCKKLSSLALVYSSLPATSTTEKILSNQNEIEVDVETARKLAFIKSTMN